MFIWWCGLVLVFVMMTFLTEQNVRTFLTYFCACLFVVVNSSLLIFFVWNAHFSNVVFVLFTLFIKYDVNKFSVERNIVFCYFFPAQYYFVSFQCDNNISSIFNQFNFQTNCAGLLYKLSMSSTIWNETNGADLLIRNFLAFKKTCQFFGGSIVNLRGISFSERMGKPPEIVGNGLFVKRKLVKICSGSTKIA